MRCSADSVSRAGQQQQAISRALSVWIISDQGMAKIAPLLKEYRQAQADQPDGTF